MALFGSPSDLADNWLRNCRWDDVFDIYPKQLPLDQRLPLRNAHSIVPLKANFASYLEPNIEPLDQHVSNTASKANCQSTVSDNSEISFHAWLQCLSNDCGFDVTQVITVAQSLAAEICNSIEGGNSFKIKQLRYVPSSSPAKSKLGGILFRVPVSRAK